MDFSQRVASVSVALGLLLAATPGCIIDSRVHQAPLSDLAGKTLGIFHSMAGTWSAVLGAETDIDHCNVLEDDAVARFNGIPVSLFRGAVHVIPPQGDDGGWECTPPSVSVDLPADLPPPWTLEIGDGSEVIRATIARSTPHAFTMKPLENATFHSRYESLVVPIERQPGDPTVESAVGTFTASNGSVVIEPGAIYDSMIQFPTVITFGTPQGPVFAHIDARFASEELLLDCENAKCGLASAAVCQDAQKCAIATTRADYTLDLNCELTGGICY